jgi:hypothetical protein
MRAAAALVVALVFLTGPPDITPARVPVVEDSAEWDCRNHGNRVCGPGNAQHVPAGRYSGP